jgi:hypothetical protein
MNRGGLQWPPPDPETDNTLILVHSLDANKECLEPKDCHRRDWPLRQDKRKASGALTPPRHAIFSSAALRKDKRDSSPVEQGRRGASGRALRCSRAQGKSRSLGRHHPCTRTSFQTRERPRAGARVQGTPSPRRPRDDNGWFLRAGKLAATALGGDVPKRRQLDMAIGWLLD